MSAIVPLCITPVELAYGNRFPYISAHRFGHLQMFPSGLIKFLMFSFDDPVKGLRKFRKVQSISLLHSVKEKYCWSCVK